MIFIVDSIFQRAFLLQQFFDNNTNLLSKNLLV